MLLIMTDQMARLHVDHVMAIAQALTALLAGLTPPVLDRPEIVGPAIDVIEAVAIKLPLFWSYQTKTWFKQFEAQFQVKNINLDFTEVYAIQALDNATAVEVSTIMNNPPDIKKYDSIKSALIPVFGLTEVDKEAMLFTIDGFGDQKTTGLLCYMVPKPDVRS